jgi:transposase
MAAPMPTRLRISEKRVSAATIRRALRPAPQARVNVACPEATEIPVAVLSAKKRTLHFLPGYAPDLNPDELVWSHTKRAGVARPGEKAKH